MTLAKADWRVSLDAVVEDCVNAVASTANTASAPLLARVSASARARAQHRAASRRQRPVQITPKALKRCRDWDESVRAMRGLPAHP